LNKKLKTGMIASAILAVIAVGGITAYLYDSKTADNVFTVGKVTIFLTEEEYDSHEDERKGLYQNQILHKDPKITNTGINDAVAFLRVDVPQRNVYLADPSGGTTAPKLQELFILADETALYPNGTDQAPAVLSAHSVDDNWLLLKTEDKTSFVSYYYGYTKLLSKDESTETLFDYVRYKAVVEGQLSANDNLDMGVTAYAIQADSIQEAGTANTITLTEPLAQTTLTTIFDVFMESPPEK